MLILNDRALKRDQSNYEGERERREVGCLQQRLAPRQTSSFRGAPNLKLRCTQHDAPMNTTRLTGPELSLR
jgi:hypothetical protein